MHEDVIIDALKISTFYHAFRGIMGLVIAVIGPWQYTTSSYHRQEDTIIDCDIEIEVCFDVCMPISYVIS